MSLSKSAFSILPLAGGGCVAVAQTKVAPAWKDRGAVVGGNVGGGAAGGAQQQQAQGGGLKGRAYMMIPRPVTILSTIPINACAQRHTVAQRQQAQ